MVREPCRQAPQQPSAAGRHHAVTKKPGRGNSLRLFSSSKETVIKDRPDNPALKAIGEGGWPNEADARELSARLREREPRLSLWWDTELRRWAIFYASPFARPQRVSTLEWDDGTYKVPQPWIANALVDSQADPALYKNMERVHDAHIRERERVSNEWAQECNARSRWLHSRIHEGHNFGHRKGIKVGAS